MNNAKLVSIFNAVIDHTRDKRHALTEVAAAIAPHATFRDTSRSERRGSTLYGKGTENVYYPKPDKGKALPKRRGRSPSETRLVLVPESRTSRVVANGVTASYGNLSAWGIDRYSALGALAVKCVCGPRAEVLL